ncbi:MAG: hypothetical protein LJE67_12780 [Salaquimonas sp.]|nr:hypothetical protein [Salaquimonas sp.]
MTNLVVPDAGFAEEFYMPFEHPALPSQQPETKPGLVRTLLDSAIRLAGKARREPAV